MSTVNYAQLQLAFIQSLENMRAHLAQRPDANTEALTTVIHEIDAWITEVKSQPADARHASLYNREIRVLAKICKTLNIPDALYLNVKVNKIKGSY
jgi:hypothetical protein